MGPRPPAVSLEGLRSQTGSAFEGGALKGLRATATLSVEPAPDTLVEAESELTVRFEAVPGLELPAAPWRRRRRGDLGERVRARSLLFASGLEGPAREAPITLGGGSGASSGSSVRDSTGREREGGGGGPRPEPWSLPLPARVLADAGRA